MTTIPHRYSKSYNAIAALALENSLPYIKGVWYYVDPDNGSNTRDGLSKAEAVADIVTAYDRCTSGAGDGIVVLSGGTGTASDTTSYLKQSLAWSKHGITVVGIAAPVAMYGRARIANQEVTTTSLTTCAQTAHSITREAGSFVTDGWVVGMTGKIADSGSNNAATFTVTAVSALALTVSETLNVQTKAQTVSSTLTSYNAEMIVVSGSNNGFLNLNIGNWSSHALALGGVKVSGARNYFRNCHIVGAGHATPAAVATAYDLEVAAGQENTFVLCTFGTDTIIRAATNGNIRFSGGAWRTKFDDCDVVSYSATSTKGHVLSAAADSFSGIQIFTRCRFMNWTPNGLTSLASAFIGTKPTSGQILMDSCSLVGFTAWDSVGANDTVYIANSAAVAAGAGGIATCV